MEDDGPLLSIGELARRAGLPVRTIRFWSDTGVLPPTARTASGRRLYDTACLARLELVATLRDLGLSLADVRRVLDGQASIAEVAAVHLDALDAQIRALRLHRAVLAVVVKRAAGNEEMTMMSKLAQMSVAERRQMIDDFLAEVFEGLEPSPVGAPSLNRWNAAPNLPDDPSPEQVDAWVEIAELVSDPDFRQRIRQVTDISMQIDAMDGLQDWLSWAHENAVAAVLRGCPPDSAEAAQVVNRILEPAAGVHPLRREEYLAGLEVVTDPRIDRYCSSRPPSSDGRRSRPICPETFGCSPHCALTSDGQATEHAEGALLTAWARAGSSAATAQPPRSNGLSCQPPCPARANLRAQTRRNHHVAAVRGAKLSAQSQGEKVRQRWAFVEQQYYHGASPPAPGRRTITAVRLG
jgi:DNA-binding transcriptional MerR regulator